MTKSKIALTIICMGAVILITGFGLDFFRFMNRPVAIPKDGMVYKLVPGTSLVHLANDLATAGYLQQPRYFRLLARFKGVTRSLKAGEYALQYGITPPNLLDLIANGRSIELSLTIVEGWNFGQVLAAIRAHDGLEQTLAGLGPRAIMEKLGHPDDHPEGRIYPDTYHFQSGTPDVVILRQAYDRLQAILDKHWSTRQDGLPFESPYDALILASIVEKETGKPSERREIAGVFVRRLVRDMKLQTDPTVIYGMGDNYKGNIRRQDLSSDNSYNTYVHEGLPPTPICMPGEPAIRAVMHPADGEFLYFVSKSDGSHYFSKSLEEHNIAVRRLQLRSR